ncbi:hypothetical protein ACX27_06410 [Nostoc piscinale CENA21]|uniref:Uncharacterized protein n=1 Tax=Nostoc piscinale CENA21 TaxID=224013 RepID=A0A0M4TTG1_9NOSO|nr:hypothetical protein ACX27_06410 [Nostoc piscinale CENA21]
MYVLWFFSFNLKLQTDSALDGNIELDMYLTRLIISQNLRLFLYIKGQFTVEVTQIVQCFYTSCLIRMKSDRLNIYLGDRLKI